MYFFKKCSYIYLFSLITTDKNFAIINTKLSVNKEHEHSSVYCMCFGIDKKLKNEKIPINPKQSTEIILTL